MQAKINQLAIKCWYPPKAGCMKSRPGMGGKKVYAKEVLQQAEQTTFIDRNGKSRRLTILPPLSEKETSNLESILGCSLPDEMRDLLSYSRGFEGILDAVDFSGNLPFEFELFPHGLSIAADECGNFWVIDLTSGGASDTTVFYVCHDPAVIAFQSGSIAQFIKEVLRQGNQPWNSQLTSVQEETVMNIWKNNPYVIERKDALKSDGDLSKFAESLDESFEFADLRNATLGKGFSWGRYGAETVCKRFGETRIFACQRRELSWFQKLFGV
ncbi:MAG: SMI1/KNR4 family protein [Candidatus Obscuribacter sp.]|nr:SMI1/KNR4 family protein [Candidatus Obscuribacter sp.]